MGNRKPKLVVVVLAAGAIALYVTSIRIGNVDRSVSGDLTATEPAPEVSNSSSSIDANTVELPTHTFPSEEAREPPAFDPREMYEKYVDLANAGDLNAKFVLFTVYEQCRNLKDPERFIDTVRRSSLPQELVDREIARAERCAPLLKLLPDPDAASIALYEEIRQSRHPLLLVQTGSLPAEEKKDRLMAAILADYPEPHLYARAFLEAATYHTLYPEHANLVRHEAWMLLHCEASLDCNVHERRRELSTTKVAEHEYGEILLTEKKIREAILRRDPMALGF